MDFLERLQKKMEIRSKIGDLQREVSELRNLISEYNVCKNDISVAMDNWKSKRIAYQNILLESVKVDLYFEGVCAENVKDKLLPTIISIDGANGTMASVRAAIPNQIQLLQDKIKELTEQIATLEAELATL